MENIYKLFITKFQLVTQFIENELGGGDILNRKNSGLIENKNLNINFGEIKGYVFHGFGCDFILKNDNIDVEFNKRNIGFTQWSLYLFTKKKINNISETEINKFLLQKVNEKKLYFDGKVYFLTEFQYKQDVILPNDWYNLILKNNYKILK